MILGTVKGRPISYINVIAVPKLAQHLPDSSWVAFTITDEENKTVIDQVINACLSRNVGYVCCAGKTGDFVEDCFDWALVSHDLAKNNLIDENDPITTTHDNFGEGFWFAATVASTEPPDKCQVVCLDFTAKGVKKHLLHLIDQINTGWLPSDEEVEYPLYD